MLGTSQNAFSFGDAPALMGLVNFGSTSGRLGPIATRLQTIPILSTRVRGKVSRLRVRAVLAVPGHSLAGGE